MNESKIIMPKKPDLKVVGSEAKPDPGNKTPPQTSQPTKHGILINNEVFFLISINEFWIVQAMNDPFGCTVKHTNIAAMSDQLFLREGLWWDPALNKFTTDPETYEKRRNPPFPENSVFIP